MLGRSYKLSVMYEDGYADEHEFIIPFSPGTYKLNINVANTIHPDGDPDFFEDHIVVDNQQRTYELGIAVANEVWGSARPDWHYATFTTPAPTLENLKWKEIAAISRAGKAKEFFSIGDKKYIDDTFGYAVIIGFDHDDLADGSGKAGITFATERSIGADALLAQSPVWSSFTEQPTRMNADATKITGWVDSDMRTITMQLIRSYSPAFNALRTYVKPVVKTYVDPQMINGTYQLKTCVDYYFLFSLAEVRASNLGYDSLREGTTYEYFGNSFSNVMPGWLRTPYYSGDFRAFLRKTSYSIQPASADATTMPIQFGFCI